MFYSSHHHYQIAHFSWWLRYDTFNFLSSFLTSGKEPYISTTFPLQSVVFLQIYFIPADFFVSIRCPTPYI